MTVLSLGQESAEQGTALFLHGFPGAIGDRNIDLANAVSQEAKIRCFLPHYQGLGESSGRFSFSQSVGDVMAFSEDFFVKNQAQDIIVVGHSWGGFLALNLLSRFPETFKRLILLSPLLEIPNEDQISRLVPLLFSKNRGTFVAQTEEALVSDFQLARESYSPLKLLSESVQEKITIIQASHDDEIPADSNRLLVRTRLPRARYFEVDQDHRFQKNRAAIKSLLIQETRRST